MAMPLEVANLDRIVADTVCVCVCRVSKTFLARYSHTLYVDEVSQARRDTWAVALLDRSYLRWPLTTKRA